MLNQNDRNAAEIVSALRAAGATVRFIEFCHGIAGCPDVVVGWGGKTWLMEIKMPKGRLSDAQKKFHAEWNGGPLVVVRSVEEALAAIGLAVAA